MIVISEVFNDNYKYIYSFSLKLTGSIEEAEDLAQDTFLKAFEKIAQLENEELVKYWLRSICLNLYLMKKRKQGESRTEELKEELLITYNTASVEDEMIASDSVKYIRSVCFLTLVHRMNEEQRVIFSLVDILGMDISEAAMTLKITEASLKGKLYRCRKKLDEELRGKCGLLSDENSCRCKEWAKMVMERENRKNAFDKHWKNREKESHENFRKNIKKLSLDMSDFIPSDKWTREILKKLEKLT